VTTAKMKDLCDLHASLLPLSPEDSSSPEKPNCVMNPRAARACCSFLTCS
jgi:hypothetical protein